MICIYCHKFSGRRSRDLGHRLVNAIPLCDRCHRLVEQALYPQPQRKLQKGFATVYALVFHLSIATAVPLLTIASVVAHAPAPRTEVRQILHKASIDVGVPERLLVAVAYAESDLKSNVVSKAGAIGVMQLLPGVSVEYGCKHPFVAKCNIYAGARYLGDLYNTYHGNIALTASAYNAGPGAVAYYHGVPPYPETIQYVRTIKEMI